MVLLIDIKFAGRQGILVAGGGLLARPRCDLWLVGTYRQLRHSGLAAVQKFGASRSAGA
jgi:hypothetical protein